MLAEMVKAGMLPPVAERLPENPRVVTPVEKVGKYGGTWRSGMVGGSDRNWLFRIAGYEPLLAWDREWSGKVIPNLAESVSSNDAATEFTVKLRKGLKWSDGKPFGSDDIGFFINDIVGNKELLPNAVDWMVSGGEPGKFEKIDDTTFKITFKEPYGVFPQRLASVYGVQMTHDGQALLLAVPSRLQQGWHRGAGQGGGRHDLDRTLHQEVRRRHGGQ